MQQRHDGPTLSRETSTSTQIRGSERKSLAGAWAALLIPAVFGFLFYGWARMPVIYLHPGFFNPLTIVLGLLVVLILGRIGWETMRLKRFGDPVLDLTQAPVPLGGTIEGRISLGSGLTDAPDFKLKLQCIHRVLQQSGKNSHWVEKILWAGESTATLLPGGIVPVSIVVPPDQEETNGRDSFDQILWRLTVTAPFRGPTFLEKYEIPVQGRTSEAQEIVEKRARTGTVISTGQVRFRTMLPFFLVGLAILAGGLYLIALGVADLDKARASAGWPSVSGHITRSQYPRGGAIFVSRSDSDFDYAFEVNSQTYVGHIISPHILWRRAAAVYPIRGLVGAFHLLYDGFKNEAVLIDTGLVGELPKLERTLHSLSLAWGDIKAILLTHGHLDHTGNLAKIKLLTGATVFAHPLEEPHIKGTFKYEGVSQCCGYLEAMGRLLLNYRSVLIDKPLCDGMELPYWGGLRVLHLPGHTEGHCGFYSQKYNLLFSGDLFASYFFITHRPPPFLNSCPKYLDASLQKVRALSPARIIPSYYDNFDGVLHKMRFDNLL